MSTGASEGRRAKRAALLALPALASALTLTTVRGANSSVSIVDVGTSGCTSMFCYVPMSLQVHAGDTVTWANNSMASHTVTRCDASACGGNGGGTGAQSGLGSPSFAPGATYAFNFTQPGTYIYYCSIHGYNTMHGTITVAAASPTPTATASPAATPTGSVAPASNPPRPSSGTGTNPNTAGVAGASGAGTAGVIASIVLVAASVRRRKGA